MHTQIEIAIESYDFWIISLSLTKLLLYLMYIAPKPKNHRKIRFPARRALTLKLLIQMQMTCCIMHPTQFFYANLRPVVSGIPPNHTRHSFETHDLSL
jgi:hypothetical protein